MSKTFYEIFSELNRIPRPSHHEEQVADYLCRFAEERGLRYRRDARNCVVIEKAATPGCEAASPVVILNHMDMVCVAKDGYMRDGRPFDPRHDAIRSFMETDEHGERWMKAEGTSLGADNGMGLSMALAILDDDSLVHPSLEVLTTTNEEDGMSGAEGLSTDFIHGRQVINLDSEAYDEITVGAAGACLQVGRWELTTAAVPSGYSIFRLVMGGGLGGHSGVDINKGRCNCINELTTILAHDFVNDDYTLSDGLLICHLNGGTANASIASWAEALIALPKDKVEWMQDYVSFWDSDLHQRYAVTDPGIGIRLERIEPQVPQQYIVGVGHLLHALQRLPYGVQAMRDDMPDTVMTSNNIGMIRQEGNQLTVSCHTRSFDSSEQTCLSGAIHDIMLLGGAIAVDRLMDTGAWVERPDSPLLALTCQTFRDVLSFEPKKVAMHFVLEAAYYVEKYPGIEIASIGPRIIEPHSPSERVSLDTADNIWHVVIELLRRLATQ